ncbi:MAG: hypothetical protein QOK20_1982 [Acidimicrobiaceae bacterium]|nr:hypothetical protein [Acidimicrobiaceae bacterium]
MSDQGGWAPPDRPATPPSIHNRPGQGADGGWQPPAPPPPPPPGGGGWQPPPPPPPPPGGGGWQPQPGPPAYGGYGGGAPQTEPLSTWSLILGILSFVICPVIAAIAAIITGVKAKKSIDRSGGAKSGRSAAVAGEVLGIVNLVLSALAIAGIAALAVGASKHTSYTSLTTGDCFNRISSSSIFSFQVDRVDCSKAHDAEVTGRFEANDPGSFPGADGFRSQAEPKCSDFANQYLGSNSGIGLRFVWVTPKQSSWDNGTHTVICGLQNADQSKHTGSVRG